MGHLFFSVKSVLLLILMFKLHERKLACVFRVFKLEIWLGYDFFLHLFGFD